MKKIIIALVAFSVVFTGCTTKSPESENTTELETKIESSEIEMESVEGVDATQDDQQVELVGAVEDESSEFDVLEHNDYDFTNLIYKSSETEKNLVIESIVKDTFFKEIENPEYSYTYNYTNLNDDEFNDVIVLLGGMEFAGSGGSTVIILKGEADGNYSLINKVTLARTPIVVTNTMTNGYKDLMFLVYGGGAEESYNMLKFDGEKYPSNPSVQQKYEAGTVFEGEALISNTAYYETLIKAGQAN